MSDPGSRARARSRGGDARRRRRLQHPVARIIIAEGPRFPEIIAAYHRESIALGRVLIGRIVERGIVTGEFQPSAVTAVPMVVVAPALMAAIWQITFGLIDPIPPSRFMAAHLALIEHGLLTGRPEQSVTPPIPTPGR